MIAITAATGTNGSLLLQALSGKGEPVRALAHSPDKVPALPDVTAVAFDLAKPETFAAALDGVQRAVLITPSDPAQPKWEADFIDAAIAANVEHLVYLSVYGVDAPNLITLALWHAESEARLFENKINWTILRPTGFMQNFFRQSAAIKGGQVVLASGAGAVPYVDVRDIVDVMAAVLAQPEHHNAKIYTLTGAEALSGDDVARIFGDALGKPVAFVDQAAADARETMIRYGMPDWYADALVELYDVYRSGAASATASGVKDATGREPRSLADFVRDHRDAFA